MDPNDPVVIGLLQRINKRFLELVEEDNELQAGLLLLRLEGLVAEITVTMELRTDPTIVTESDKEWLKGMHIEAEGMQ